MAERGSDVGYSRRTINHRRKRNDQRAESPGQPAAMAAESKPGFGSIMERTPIMQSFEMRSRKLFGPGEAFRERHRWFARSARQPVRNSSLHQPPKGGVYD